MEMLLGEMGPFGGLAEIATLWIAVAGLLMLITMHETQPLRG